MKWADRDEFMNLARRPSDGSATAVARLHGVAGG